MAVRFVLDASALLAYLFNEGGREFVDRLLPESGVSVVNLSEVYAKLLAKGMGLTEAEESLYRTHIETLPFDAELALEAAKLSEPTRRQGLSLADRACLATARRMGATAVTADRAWMNLGIDVKVMLCRTPAQN
ncbi:MAG: type II toxin-antitoxin system VapC family toxin [Candidatus Solibacter usitatus]|nr:type II toxin-antitoxin system VapC family toxin [Candidatus Solibacter usitatus]